MCGKGGITVRFQLCPQGGMLRWWDGSTATGWPHRCERSACPSSSKPALDRGQADIEGGDHIVARHAALNSLEHTLSQIKRVSTHKA
jgi:hypothetical protein